MSDFDQEVRNAFFEYNRDLRIACSKIASMLVVIFMPFGASLDYFVYPEEFHFFLWLRIICAALALVLWQIVRGPLGRRYYRVLGMGWYMLPILFISIMIYFKDGASSPYYAGLNLVLIAGTLVAFVNFLESLIALSLTLFIYGVACVAHGGGTLAEYYNNFYFIALTGVVSVAGSFLIYRQRFREFALRAELDRNRKQLEENNAKLVEMDRAKSTFFANVSHELRTPLTLLIGPLERLRHGPATALREQGEMLDIMYNNAMRLLRLINDLLDLVRLDSGAIRIRREATEPIAFLEGIAKSVSHMASQRSLHFSWRNGIAGNTQIFVDKDKIEKIILNLLFNSFKFTPEGGEVILEASLNRQDLKITVRDTGKGIAEADLPHIFDRFWQAEGAATRKYQGVGIGLALVKELAEAHGGSVSVESKVDKGTNIQVIVNATGDGEIEPEHHAPSVEKSQPEQNEWLTQLYRRAELFPAHVIGGEADARADDDEPDQAKPRILVADDEPEMRRFLNSQLKGAYTVYEARNGSQALELARSHDFHLMLLDLMMPGIDGITLTRQLREEPRTDPVPIVMLTARADEDSKTHALEAGVTDFLTKPFASSELTLRCRNLLKLRELQLSLERKSQELEAALEQIKATEAQLVHQAKMASLGQLSSGLMHEINNPLNFANTASHLLLKRLNKIPIEDRESINVPLRDLQDGIRRVSDIIGNLRSFIHPDTSNFGTISLREVLETAARFVQINPAEINLEIAVPEDLKVWANRNQLIHLFINLFQNAADSLREKDAPNKKIKIEAGLQNGRILLTCEDNGKGIKPVDQDKIFDAFFTTKPVGSGMGLGLNICYRIIQNHLGEIRIDSRENEFCRFTIILNQNKTA